MKQKIFAVICVFGMLMLISCEQTTENPTEEAITITSSQIQPFFAPGKALGLYGDSINTNINIGNTGGPNVYDFTNLSLFLGEVDTFFSVSQNPKLANRYPLTAVALKQSRGSGGFEFAIFSVTATQWLDYGNARIESDTVETYEHRVPAHILLNFPVTYNDSWTQTYNHTDTTYINGIPQFPGSGSETENAYVDGWGTLKLPGMADLNCLRIRSVRGTPPTEQEFWYFTQEGIFLVIGSPDPQTTTGFVPVDEIFNVRPIP